MNKMLPFFKAHKKIVIPLFVIFSFVLLRTVLLQKPNTELTYRIKQDDLVDTVQVSGTYTTASQTQITSPTNGIISQLYVSNGNEVEKGDPLFHVESTATVSQQQSAYADYQSAISALQTAKNTKETLDATMWTKQQAYLSAQNTQNYKNNHTQNPSTDNSYTDLEKLQIDNAVTQTLKDFRAAEQSYKTADTAVTAAQAAVNSASIAYNETKSTTVTAPVSGTVVNLLVTEGDQVAAPVISTAQTTGSAPVSQPVLVIANLGNPYIKADISEDYAARISPDQKATIVFDALKDQTFAATVGSVALVGATTQGVVTYPVRIQTEVLPDIIKPNMTAVVTIETLRKNNILTVPNSSIATRGESTYVIEAKSHKHLPVKTGVKGVTKTEILSGLQKDMVIVANPTE